jgi:predicted small integral membrane protein
LLFFFGGFQVIGSEWFGMWQSDVLWKSVSGTMRSALFLMGTLIFVSMKNDD